MNEPTLDVKHGLPLVNTPASAAQHVGDREGQQFLTMSQSVTEPELVLQELGQEPRSPPHRVENAANLCPVLGQSDADPLTPPVPYKNNETNSLG